MGFWILFSCIVAVLAVIGLAAWAKLNSRETSAEDREWDAAIK